MKLVMRNEMMRKISLNSAFILIYLPRINCEQNCHLY